MSASGTRECPFCAETIKAAAVVCRFCGRELPSPGSTAAPASSGSPAPAEEPLGSPASLHKTEVFDLLSSLVQKSLVGYEEDEHGRGRYRLLETVRQYARDRLLETEEGGALRSRHLRCFMALAERADAEAWGPEMVEWLDRLETELDNLRAALEWGAGTAEPAEEWLRLQAALPDFWVKRDHITEGHAWIEQAGRAEGAAAPVRAPLLSGVASMRFWASDPRDSGELSEESLHLYTQLQDERRISWLLFTRAISARLGGDPESARAWSAKTLAVSRRIEADYVTAWCLMSQGTIDRRTAEGIALLEESVELARRCGNLWVQAWATRDLGHALFEHRQFERGRALVAESCRLFEQVGCRWAHTWSLESWGNAVLTGGDLAGARRLFDESIALYRELKERGREAGALLNAGRVARDQGDTAAARAYFSQSRRIAEEQDDRWLVVATLHNLGEVARLEQAYEEAGQLLDESLALARAADDRDGVLATRHKQARLAADQGEWTRARTCWIELITRAREWDRQHAFPDSAWLPGSDPAPEVYPALEGISRAWLQQGEARQAVRLLGAVTAARDAWPPALWGFRPSDHAPAESLVPALQAALGPEGWEAAWSEGQAMTLQQAVDDALEQGVDPR